MVQTLGSRDPLEVVKDEMVMRERILSALAKHPQTVPELALALKVPATDVMLWVMAMWRYGFLEEQGKPDSAGYYKFQPVE